MERIYNTKTCVVGDFSVFEFVFNSSKNRKYFDFLYMVTLVKTIFRHVSVVVVVLLEQVFGLLRFFVFH